MAGKEHNKDYDPNSLPDLLPIFYKRLFPYGPYFRWLNYGGVPKTYYSHRELSFTLKDDIYIRYQSFSDQQDMEKEMQKRCPYKIDIGAVFSHRPKDHKTVRANAFQAQERELVFDIDMTDYDDVRNCCSGADICANCWPLMRFAVKIMQRALTEDFGFEHIFWVYSGRRGIHCWVCDEAARKLSQTARSAIAEYLSVVKGGENQVKKVVLSDTHIHPSISKALDIISHQFSEYAVKKQSFLEDDDKVEKVLALIPDEKVRKLCEERFSEDKCFNSSKRWHALKNVIEAAKTLKDCKKSKMAVEEIMLQYAYPRLDVNVSKGVNHLLKSPFCVHPKTGRVCVPMDPDDIDNFDPFAVPTISKLCDELNDNEKSVSSEESTPKRKTRDYRSTSLKTGVEVFEKFLKKIETTWKGKLMAEGDAKREF